MVAGAFRIRGARRTLFGSTRAEVTPIRVIAGRFAVLDAREAQTVARARLATLTGSSACRFTADVLAWRERARARAAGALSAAPAELAVGEQALAGLADVRGDALAVGDTIQWSAQPDLAGRVAALAGAFTGFVTATIVGAIAAQAVAVAETGFGIFGLAMAERVTPIAVPATIAGVIADLRQHAFAAVVFARATLAEAVAGRFAAEVADAIARDALVALLTARPVSLAQPTDTLGLPGGHVAIVAVGTFSGGRALAAEFRDAIAARVAPIQTVTAQARFARGDHRACPICAALFAGPEAPFRTAAVRGEVACARCALGALGARRARILAAIAKIVAHERPLTNRRLLVGGDLAETELAALADSVARLVTADAEDTRIGGAVAVAEAERAVLKGAAALLP